MIKHLRRRFIIIMMSLISTVLIIIFAVQIISSAEKMKSDSLRGLDLSIEHLMKAPPLDIVEKPDTKDRSFNGPSPFSTVYISYNEDGMIDTVYTINNDFDLEKAEVILAKALKQKNLIGTLPEFSLRYKAFQMDDGTSVMGFIDISYELAFLRQQIYNFLLIGALSLSVFFAISLLLSNIAVKPIAVAWTKQQQFIADASHELRTPITVLLANTSILLSEREGLTQKTKKWVTRIDEEAKQMKRLVEDLLFLARMDAGGRGEVLNTVDFSDIVQNSALAFDPVAFEHGKQIEANITPDLKILGDEGKIKQLTSILLDNALKFSVPESTIGVTLKKENEKAVLSIHNQSEPIDPGTLEKLFDRFYKADNARTRENNSYGLGLAIAKEIVDMMNGKIHAEYQVEKGMTFTAYFPIIKSRQLKQI